MRDFIAEQTDFEAETAETVLAHNSGSKVEKACRRGDLLEKRRRLVPKIVPIDESNRPETKKRL